MKRLRITVEGKVYEVTVEVLDQPATADAPMPVSTGSVPVAPPPSSTAQPVAAAAAGDVPSPLSGKIAAVSVTVGQKVNAGDQLVTLEAMKMNTYVYAPGAGTVSAIHVNAGDSVQEGQPLVRLE